MTGPGWPGRRNSTAPTADTHDAIHFHDDDVADVGWPESHRLRRSRRRCRSGVYAAAASRTAAREDHLPFFVAPPAVGSAGAARRADADDELSRLCERIARRLRPARDLAAAGHVDQRRQAYDYVAANGLKSTYDLHRDGSGIIHGVAPPADHRFPPAGALPDLRRAAPVRRRPPSDRLADREGLRLRRHHRRSSPRRGADLLAPYRVVVTGSHPEYWTGAHARRPRPLARCAAAGSCTSAATASTGSPASPRTHRT